MKENEMLEIGKYIADIINNLSDLELRQKIRNKVLNLCQNFPIYKND